MDNKRPVPAKPVLIERKVPFGFSPTAKTDQIILAK
jgi:hypothetical protein